MPKPDETATNLVLDESAIVPWADFAHTGPGTLAGRFMRGFWQPISRSEDLNPGYALPKRIMGEGFTLYRGEGGAAHLLDFRCAHRGTQLSLGWVEGDCLRCAYHGWVYDGTGQCVEQPAEDAMFAAKVRIRSYPVEEYLGLIFAFVGEGEPPPLPRYPEFEEDAGLIEVDHGVRRYNYFQTLENGGDHVHVTFAHGRRVRDETGAYDSPEIEAWETEWGFSISAQHQRRPSFVRHYGMPNVHIHPKAPRLPRHLRQELGLNWVNSIAWRAVPIDDQSFLTFEVTFVPVTGEAAERYLEYRERARAMADATPRTEDLADKIMAGELRFLDLEEMEDARSALMGNVGDYATQAGQGMIAERGPQHERLGRSDAAVIVQRQLWARELRALAEGRPLKQWIRPAEQASSLAGRDPAYVPAGI